MDAFHYFPAAATATLPAAAHAFVIPDRSF
jgi:hypothetical protein